MFDAILLRLICLRETVNLIGITGFLLLPILRYSHVENNTSEVEFAPVFRWDMPVSVDFSLIKQLNTFTGKPKVIFVKHWDYTTLTDLIE
jgi:hypothetical protein